MYPDLLDHHVSFIQVITTAFLVTASISLATVVTSYIRAQNLKKPKVDVPILGLGKNKDYAEASNYYLFHFKQILEEGYQKFKNDVYQVWGIDGYLVIVSPRFVEELNALGTDVLDVHTASQTRIIGEYEWLRIADPLLFHSILTDLTRQTGSLVPAIRKEIDYGLVLHFPSCEDFTPLVLWPRLLKIMALVVSLMTVGPDLSRNEVWLSTMVEFLDDLFAGGWELKSWSISLRPIVARGLVPGIRRVWKHQSKARELLLPIIKERRRVKAEAIANGRKYEKPNDLLQWMTDNAAKSTPPKSDAMIAELCLVVGFGALHASSMTLTNVIFDLATRPEYMPILREEYEQVLRENQATNGNEASLLNNLIKLDSFMKESQRLNPVALTSFSRQIRKPITMSTGLKLPKGTHILVPASIISIDDTLYPSPLEFNGLRFYERRKASSGNALHRNQFTSTSPEQMHFGFGRQACPGRYFGSAAIKCIVVSLLRDFDVKLVNEKEGRPENHIKGSMSFPSETAEIMFKRR